RARLILLVAATCQPNVCLRLAQCDDAHHLAHDRDVRREIGVEIRFGERQHARVADGRSARRARFARQKGHLAEDVPRAEERENAFGLTLGDEDLYPSIRDDEERVPEIALLKKRLSLAITV